MKVYVLYREYYYDYGGDLGGVFSSREKAIESFKFQELEFTPDDIYEYEMDEQGLVEYGEQFLFGIDSEGETWDGGQWKPKSDPADVKFGESTRKDGPTHVIAVAWTREEAKSLAMEEAKKRGFGILNL